MANGGLPISGAQYTPNPLLEAQAYQAGAQTAKLTPSPTTSVLQGLVTAEELKIKETAAEAKKKYYELALEKKKTDQERKRAENEVKWKELGIRETEADNRKTIADMRNKQQMEGFKVRELEAKARLYGKSRVQQKEEEKLQTLVDTQGWIEDLKNNNGTTFNSFYRPGNINTTRKLQAIAKNPELMSDSREAVQWGLANGVFVTQEEVSKARSWLDSTSGKKQILYMDPDVERDDNQRIKHATGNVNMKEVQKLAIEHGVKEHPTRKFVWTIGEEGTKDYKEFEMPTEYLQEGAQKERQLFLDSMDRFIQRTNAWQTIEREKAARAEAMLLRKGQGRPAKKIPKGGTRVKMPQAEEGPVSRLAQPPTSDQRSVDSIRQRLKLIARR